MPASPLKFLLATMLATSTTVACAAPPATPRSAPAATAAARSAAPAAGGAAAKAARAAPIAPIAPIDDPRLPRVRQAIAAAERGAPLTGFADLADHPLYGWIQYAGLQRDIATLPPARAQAFLGQYKTDPAGRAFRRQWLGEVARREDWAAFAAAWEPDIESTGLRCAELNARQALGRADAQWVSDAQAIWRSSGRSLPDACDTVFAALDARGALTPALRWERIDLAIAEGQPAVLRSAARGLPADQQALANDYAAFLGAVHPRALDWPKTDRSRLVASHGLARLGKDNPDAAEAQLPQYARALAFTPADRGRVLYQIALWTVASYLPDSARRLNLVPEASYDERLHEWRAREAMARSDWPAALAAIRKMPPAQRADSRWTYFEARLAERTGAPVEAQRLYAAAARRPEFHGFLAADRLEQPYALCPLQPAHDPAMVAAVAADPAIGRALRLHRIDRDNWAVAEWNAAMARFGDAPSGDARRVIAVEMAQANDWFDRAVFSLGRGKPDELRMYHLRFPLHHDATIRREAARNRIDPAWVAGEIRAESIFTPDVRSSAEAMGLMQVLPSTGAAVARRIGVPWSGAQSLYDPQTNIVLGTAYLRQMLDTYGGQPYLAIAGYNAGPAPLNRWREQRPQMDPDFWIETISYKETREYVARVLAFSVIYDWRLDGDALALSDRMRGRIDGTRKTFMCPVPGA